VDPARDLVAEKEKEQKDDQTAALAKVSRFQARKVTAPARIMPSAPEYENLIFAAVANNPLADLADFSSSSYVPNCHVLFYLLNFMDFTMAGTKRWIDNCMGWAPPISQMYISVLVYVQILRAMDCASAIPPGSPHANFLITFQNVFPLNELWIPGPLVAFFRHISAFWPSATDRFGNVTPILPDTPGWTRALFFRLGAYNASNVPNRCLPNVSAFISRLRSICTIASAAGTTQATFSANISGPNSIRSLFGSNLNNGVNEQWILSGPGVSYIYPDNLQMWQNTAASLNRLRIPADLVAAAGANATVPINEWSAFIRFSQNANEHEWFGPVAAVMAKYCQFFKGSAPLGEISPNCSAAAAVKGRTDAVHNMHVTPTWNPQAGTGASTEIGNANAAAHYTAKVSSRCVLSVRCALEGIPDNHVYAGIGFALNAYESQAVQTAMRRGTFWSLGPDTAGRDNVEVLPGMLSAIVHKYHSDTRIDSSKQ